MMSAALELKSVAIKCVTHPSVGTALQAFDDDVRHITCRAVLAQSESRRLTRDFPLVHVFDPREISQMSTLAAHTTANCVLRRSVPFRPACMNEASRDCA